MTEIPKEQETQLVAQSNDILARAKEIQVRNDDEQEIAIGITKTAKVHIKSIKDFFEPIKSSAHTTWKEIVAREKSSLAILEEVERILKQKVSNYQMEQERKRKEAEEEARRKMQEEADRLLAEAVASGDEEILEEALEYEEHSQMFTVAKSTEKPQGTSFIVDYDVTVVDENKVPILVNGVVVRPVDVGAVKRIVKQTKGEVKIPGVKVEETRQIRIRS